MRAGAQLVLEPGSPGSQLDPERTEMWAPLVPAEGDCGRPGSAAVRSVVEEVYSHCCMLNVNLRLGTPSTFSNNTYLRKPGESKRHCFLNLSQVTCFSALNYKASAAEITEADLVPPVVFFIEQEHMVTFASPCHATSWFAVSVLPHPDQPSGPCRFL